jgi:AcrR family transcriptional regulator
VTVPDVRYSDIVWIVATHDKSDPRGSRDRILDAASRILVRDGGDAVTIAAVAAEAGLSKGGLFYHFASKEALIVGLVDRFVAAFDALLDVPDTPGSATLAYLDATAADSGPASQPVLALLAAALTSPDALNALRARYAMWQTRLENDGIDPAVATLVRLVADGLWLSDAFDLAPPSVDLRSSVVRRLHALVDASL